MNVRAFLWLDPRTRIKGKWIKWTATKKEPTKRTPVYGNDRRCLCVFCYNSNIHHTDIIYIWTRRQGICTRESRGNNRTNTYRWKKNKRNVARTKKNTQSHIKNNEQNITVFFYFTEIVVNNPRIPSTPPQLPPLPLPTSISCVLRVLYFKKTRETSFLLVIEACFSLFLYFERVQVDDDGAAGTDVID